MISKNEEELIHAIADADLGENLMIGITSALNDEQMPIMTEYIRAELEEGRKITENNIIEAMLIITGDIEVEDE